MKKIVANLPLFILFTTVVDAQQVDRLVSRLHDYTLAQAQEKIYVHFDKSLYSIGDTVWFKVYLVDAESRQLSSHSKVAYVDVQGPQALQRQLVIPLQMGMGWGQLVLSDSLYHAGKYALRAYTRWMRNAGPDYFFKHTLQVGQPFALPAKGQASFSEVTGGVQAMLSYTLRDGKGLIGRPVSYRLLQGDKVVFSGKLETDASGRAGVTFSKDKLKGDEVLETETTLASGALIKDRFKVNQRKELALDFFPEGGWLVAGIRSKVGFKAVNSAGSSQQVKGYIADEQGNQVALFESGHGGMGTFSFSPEAGRRYTAVISEGNYSQHKQVLPEVKASGYVLSVNPLGKDSLRVRVSRQGQAGNSIHLLIQAHGTAQKALSLPMNSGAITFTLSKQGFAEGINHLTLFSPTFEPLAERLFFVYGNKTHQEGLTADKETYTTREDVKLSLSVNDGQGKGIVGGYSVAVVLADKLPVKEEDQLSIHASLLLNSDLRGAIESPNYYFTDYTEQKAAALDALLLTQGWRRFSWKEVLEQSLATQQYKTEDGLMIAGQVTDKNGNGISGAKINLLAAKQMLMLDTLSDAKGYFRFKDIALEDSATVIIRARGVKDKDRVKIALEQTAALPPMELELEWSGDEPLAADTAMKAYLNSTASLFERMEKSGRIIQGTTLKTVEIVTKKKIPEIKGSVYPFAAPPPDHTFEPDKLQEMVNLETHLMGLMGLMVKGNQIWGRDPKNFKKPEGRMIILLNGSMIEDLAGINPKALTGVQIVKGGTAAANMSDALMLDPALMQAYEQSPGYGIVFLTMAGIPAKFIKAERPDGFVQYEMNAYHMPREFYVPRYYAQKEKPAIDFRSTLFWKPDLITGEDGKAEFDFYTSDERGRYRITLEGIGANGELSRIIKYVEVR